MATCGSSTATATSMPTGSRSDAEAVLEAARRAGLERILVPGWNVASSERALDLAERHAWLDVAVGIHPHDAAKVAPDGWDRIVEWAADPRVVAIGETGLDYDRVFSPIPEQLANLRRNLDLAARHRQAGHPPLPVGGGPARRAGRPRDASSRGRGSRRSAVGIGLSTTGRLRSIHSFSGPLDYACEMLELGLAISFSGLVFRRGEESFGRGRHAGARRPSPRRDRFALSCAARCASLDATSPNGFASRPPGLPNTARRRSRRSAPAWSTPTTDVPSAQGRDMNTPVEAVPRPSPQLRRPWRSRVWPAAGSLRGSASGPSLSAIGRPGRAPATAAASIAARTPRRDDAGEPVRHNGSTARAAATPHRLGTASAATCAVGPQAVELPSDRFTSVVITPRPDDGRRHLPASATPSLPGPPAPPIGVTRHRRCLRSRRRAAARPIDLMGEHASQIRFRNMSIQNDVGQPVYEGPTEYRPRPARPPRSGPLRHVGGRRRLVHRLSTGPAACRSLAVGNAVTLTIAHS